MKKLRKLSNIYTNIILFIQLVSLVGLLSYIFISNINAFEAANYMIILAAFVLVSTGLMIIFERYVDNKELRKMTNKNKEYQLIIFGDIVNFPTVYTDSTYRVTLIGLQMKTYNVTKEIYKELKDNNQHLERWTYC